MEEEINDDNSIGDENCCGCYMDDIEDELKDYYFENNEERKSDDLLDKPNEDNKKQQNEEFSDITNEKKIKENEINKIEDKNNKGNEKIEFYKENEINKIVEDKNNKLNEKNEGNEINIIVEDTNNKLNEKIECYEVNETNKTTENKNNNSNEKIECDEGNEINKIVEDTNNKGNEKIEFYKENEINKVVEDPNNKLSEKNEYDEANETNKIIEDTNNKKNEINENYEVIEEKKGDIKTNNIKDDFKKIKLYERDELYVNLIHFDLKMANKENYMNYNKFKVDVVGGFYAIDDYNILKQYLETIKKKDIPFIVISSGESGKEVISICKNYSFIKEIIIFCRNYEYNEHYIKENPGYVKKVFTSIKSVYNYIKTFGSNEYKDGVQKYNEDQYTFSSEEIQRNRQIKECPVISVYEYDKCAYLVHKVYSDFFGDINNKNENHMFSMKNLIKIHGYINNLSFSNVEKVVLKEMFVDLFNSKDNDEFIEKSIRYYTGESSFCYLFNRVMRQFEKGLISLAYYMGPLLYGLNKYVKENPDFAISKNIVLYRKIECSKLDFYLYKLNLGHIICFPSLTSTSSKKIKFEPTKLGKNINNNNENDEMVKVKLIFEYKHKKGNISPGIRVENKRDKKGELLSKNPHEMEILLFPFTFARIIKIQPKKENGEIIQVIKLSLINKTSYIEYILKNDVDKRIIMSKLDLA